ncbi:hypothetical protein GCM10018781_23350 [Kitasatospora indigofera]|uniref:Uncharacterized protein n=1 Tax=Kitasatospora indigofera TaxID=67307 RepID=A0A919FKX2_9ACTN|nr:hypothetical protein GCM10018781_23350 [Kitasatospora indigofera]
MLIAAAFCMDNRYVSCLDTGLPADRGYCTEGARRIVAHGYGSPR